MVSLNTNNGHWECVEWETKKRVNETYVNNCCFQSMCFQLGINWTVYKNLSKENFTGVLDTKIRITYSNSDTVAPYLEYWIHPDGDIDISQFVDKGCNDLSHLLYDEQICTKEAWVRDV